MIFVSCQQEADSLTASSSAYSANASSKWSKSAFPINLKIATNFDNDETNAVKDMAAAWSTSIDDKINIFNTSHTTTNKSSNNLDSYADSTMGVYKLTSWPSELPSSALAVTQIYGTRKNVGKSSEYIQITHADILVNYENYSFTTDGTWGYDFQTVLLHELGHFIGLYHSYTSVEESVMYPSITRYVENRAPKTQDIIDLKSKYGLSQSVVASLNAGSSDGPNNTQALIADAEEEEKVIVVFELMADWSEKVTIKPMREL